MLLSRNVKGSPLHSLRMSENKMLVILFVPRKRKARGGRRKLHNEELHDLYC